MLDFVAATVAGLVAGVVFELYFRRYADATARLPTVAGRPSEETDGGTVAVSADDADTDGGGGGSGSVVEDREGVRRT
jgi:hypothetical protein